MNLVSAAGAFGIVVAIFQWGWGSSLIGLSKTGPIEPFLPVLAFALLFGLSMDYQVFLVSRIHEEWTRSRNNRRAVLTGQTETTGVITAAATIMIFVFGTFVLSDSRTIKLVGLSMAVAVALDAFVIRQFVVPGLLYRLGAANWWIPAWLDRWLPRVSIEGAGEPAAPDLPAAAASPGQVHSRNGPFATP